MPWRGWLRREAKWARDARHRRSNLLREVETARAVDEVIESEPPEPPSTPVWEVLRFWFLPVTVVAVTAGVGMMLMFVRDGIWAAVGASTVAGVVAAVVVIPIQAVMARRAAQMEFRRHGELLRVVVDRILEEVEEIIDLETEEVATATEDAATGTGDPEPAGPDRAD